MKPAPSGDPIRVEDIGNGLLRLRAEAVTGVIRIGNTDIETAPKFLSVEGGSWQTVLWRILTVVEGGHVDDNLTTAHQLASLSIPDLLAEMFLVLRQRSCSWPASWLSSRPGRGNTLRGKLGYHGPGEWLARPWELPMSLIS